MRRSYSLIEMVMVIAVMGVVITALGTMNKRMVVDTYQYVEFRDEIMANARPALRMMSREIRGIKDDTSVFIANQNRLQFHNVDGDTVDFFLSGSDLMYNAATLCSHVSSLEFSYIDADNQPIANPLVHPDETDIEFIKVDLVFQQGEEIKQVDLWLRPRNL